MNLFGKGGKGDAAPAGKAPVFSPIDRTGLLGLLDQVVNTGQSGVLELHEPRGNWVYAFQGGALTHASGGRVRGARQAFDLLWEFQAGEFTFTPGVNPGLAGNLYIDKGRLLDLLHRSQAVLQGPSAPYIPPNQQRPIAPVSRSYSPPNPSQMPPPWQPGVPPQGWPAAPQQPGAQGWPAPAYGQQPGYPPAGYPGAPAPGQPYPTQPYPAAPGPQAPPMPPQAQPMPPQTQPMPPQAPAYPGYPQPAQQVPMAPPAMPVQPQVMPQPQVAQPAQPYPPQAYPPQAYPQQAYPQQPYPQQPQPLAAQPPVTPARQAAPQSFSVPPMPIPKKVAQVPAFQPAPAALPAPAQAAPGPDAKSKDDLAALRASLAAQAPVVKPVPSGGWNLRKADGTVAPATVTPLPAKGKSKDKAKAGDSKLVAAVKVQLIKFLLWACERRYSPDDHWTLKDAFEVSTMELRDQFLSAFSQTLKSASTPRASQNDDDDVDDMTAGRMRGRGRRH